MNAELVKKFRSIAEKRDVNLEILFDNMEILNTKGQGCVVNFDDATETVVYTRITDNPTRMLVGPLEFGVRSYDDIQKITIQATAKDMFGIIDDAASYCGNKAEDMKKFVKETPASVTYHATPSTDNVTDRAGTKPTIYSTNAYNSANESRRKSNAPKRVTVTVNEDGTISGAEKIPKPSDAVTQANHMDKGTIM